MAANFWNETEINTVKYVTIGKRKIASVKAGPEVNTHRSLSWKSEEHVQDMNIP